MFGSPLRVEPVRRARAGAAARRAAVVGLAHAVAQRPLTPVVGVQRLLHEVRPEDRRDRADLLDPLGVVDRAGALPGREAPLLEQPDGVLTQPAPVERVLQLHDLHVAEAGLGRTVLDRVVDRRQGRVDGPVGVVVPEAAAPGVLTRVAGLAVAEAAARRDRGHVVLDDDRELRRRVAGVRHRGVDVQDRVPDRGRLGGDVRRREVRCHRRVVVAVVLPPRRRGQPVGRRRSARSRRS